MTVWDWLWFFFIVVPLTLFWIFALIDIFSRSDLSGWAKAIWVVAIIVVPWLGLLVYLIVRPPTATGVLSPRPAQAPAQPVTGATSVADELERLSRLQQDGMITRQEYDAAKEAVLKRAA